MIELLPAFDVALAIDPVLPAGMEPNTEAFPGPRPGGFTSLLGSAVGAFLTTLIVAATINGGLTLTGIGGIVTFAVGTTGFGTVLRAYL